MAIIAWPFGLALVTVTLNGPVTLAAPQFWQVTVTGTWSLAITTGALFDIEARPLGFWPIMALTMTPALLLNDTVGVLLIVTLVMLDAPQLVQLTTAGVDAVLVTVTLTAPPLNVAPQLVQVTIAGEFGVVTRTIFFCETSKATVPELANVTVGVLLTMTPEVFESETVGVLLTIIPELLLSDTVGVLVIVALTAPPTVPVAQLVHVTTAGAAVVLVTVTFSPVPILMLPQLVQVTIPGLDTGLVMMTLLPPVGVCAPA